MMRFYHPEKKVETEELLKEVASAQVYHLQFVNLWTNNPVPTVPKNTNASSACFVQPCQKPPGLLLSIPGNMAQNESSIDQHDNIVVRCGSGKREESLLARFKDLEEAVATRDANTLDVLLNGSRDQRARRAIPLFKSLNMTQKNHLQTACRAVFIDMWLCGFRVFLKYDAIQCGKCMETFLHDKLVSLRTRVFWMQHVCLPYLCLDDAVSEPFMGRMVFASVASLFEHVGTRKNETCLCWLLDYTCNLLEKESKRTDSDTNPLVLFMENRKYITSCNLFKLVSAASRHRPELVIAQEKVISKYGRKFEDEVRIAFYNNTMHELNAPYNLYNALSSAFLEESPSQRANAVTTASARPFVRKIPRDDAQIVRGAIGISRNAQIVRDAIGIFADHSRLKFSM